MKVSQSKAFGRRFGHEGITLTSEVSALVKDPQSPLAPSVMGTHSEQMAVYELRSWPSPDPESSGALTLDLPDCL